MFLVKKEYEIKYRFEDTTSNVDLRSGGNQPINVKLCETLALSNDSNK